MKLAKKVIEAMSGEKQRADAISMFFASWKESDLKELLDSVEGRKSSKLNNAKLIKKIKSEVMGDVAFGLKDVANGIKKQLG